MKNDIILTLYSRPETVFSVHEISQYIPEISSIHLKNRLYHAVKTGKLKRVRQGIYAKAGYNPLELATKIYTPSYISLETVLVQQATVFQHYTTVFVASYLTREIIADGTVIQLRKIHDRILTNTSGIERKPGYYIATRERAFLDAVYMYKNYHFDNLGSLDWEKINEYKTIYANTAFTKRVSEYYKAYNNEYGTH